MPIEKVLARYVSLFVILLLAVFLFLGLEEFFSAFLGAVVFYTLFRNLMRFLHKKKRINRSLSAVIIILISFIIVILPLGILFTVIFNKVSELMQEPEIITAYTDKLMERSKHLPFKVETGHMAERAQELIANNVGRVLNSSLLILGNLLMMYFFLFFLLISYNRLEASIIHYLPYRRSQILLFGNELVDQTYSNALGVPLVCVGQGAFAYLSYRIAGLPEAMLWAILTGFSSVIPLVGTAIIWVPASVFLMADGHTWQGIFVAAYSIVVMTNVDNLIRMIVSKKIGDVHPVITVLGVILGLKYFGLPGLVFGPLLISYFIILLKLYHAAHGGRKPGAAPAPVHEEINLVKLVLNGLNFFKAASADNKKK